MCHATITHIVQYISNEAAKPLFGICLGHQLLSLAVGAKAYKMKCVCVRARACVCVCVCVCVCILYVTIVL